MVLQILIFLTLVITYLIHKSTHLLENSFVPQGPPDSWLGWKSVAERTTKEELFTVFQPHVLLDFFERVGENGRFWRFCTTVWDIFPYMFIYTVWIGTFMVRGLTNM